MASREPLDGSAGQSDSVYFPFGSGTESHVTCFVLTLAELLESFFLKVVCESVEKVCEHVYAYTGFSFLIFFFFFFFPSECRRCLLQNEAGCCILLVWLKHGFNLQGSSLRPTQGDGEAALS